MTRLQLTLLALSLGLSGACGSSTAPTNGNLPPPPVLPNDVRIVVGASALSTTAFNPYQKTVSLSGAPSVSVRWVNNDISGGDYQQGTAVSHNITPDTPGDFTPSGTLGGNRSYSVAFTAAGDYPYHCSIHTNMIGLITVNP
jgi:plastocyanin